MHPNPHLWRMLRFTGSGIFRDSPWLFTERILIGCKRRAAIADRAWRVPCLSWDLQSGLRADRGGAGCANGPEPNRFRVVARVRSQGAADVHWIGIVAYSFCPPGRLQPSLPVV